MWANVWCGHTHTATLSLFSLPPSLPFLSPTRTSCPVGMCFASLTLAKFPFPIVFNSLYFPTYISSPGGLLEVPFDLDEDPPPLLPEDAPADEGRVWPWWVRLLWWCEWEPELWWCEEEELPPWWWWWRWPVERWWCPVLCCMSECVCLFVCREKEG